MRPKRYSSEGIVLARRNYSEADRILVVYSKNYGKIHLIAKGVRKTSSRKRGSLEIFSNIKFSAARGKNLDILTEAEIVDSFPTIRKNLKKVAVGYYLMEVIGRVTREDEKNVELYSLLTEYLDKLRGRTSLGNLRRNFVRDVLTLIGFWPKGKPMENPDYVLEDVVEREMFSARVGKRLLS